MEYHSRENVALSGGYSYAGEMHAWSPPGFMKEVKTIKMVHTDRRLGAEILEDGSCSFKVWAPYHRQVEVHLTTPLERMVTLEKDDRGYHSAVVEGVPAGSLYRYRLNGEKERPDPTSRFQPDGVHGPSMVTDREFPWQDDCWRGSLLENYIIYEIHVGTFTGEGTFAAVVSHLDELVELGVTALEIMPVSQFPGDRNWGYDGCYAFSVQNSYGGPDEMKRLVDECHRRGLAVILDVVYNHFGPEGNYLWDYGPYFTDRYRTPWGDAVNFDGPSSEEVRRFFIESALYWITDFHIDALRIDAVHAIMDFSARPFLMELGRAVHERAKALNRNIYLMPESDLNDTRLLRSRSTGGFGLDSQWTDDFHHSVHALLTGERSGYYEDFGRFEHLVKAYRNGFVYSGQYSCYRGRRHGISSAWVPPERFIVFSQNHDQVGNRLFGERLSELVSFEALKLIAGLVLFSPYVPLLFMGEEYGERARFPYFMSHTDPDLVEAVRKGRREEFSSFLWQGVPPDPQDPQVFESAKLDRSLKNEKEHCALLDYYKAAIGLRKSISALGCVNRDDTEVEGREAERVLICRRGTERSSTLLMFNAGDTDASVSFMPEGGTWKKRLYSAETRWGGPDGEAPAELEGGEAATLALKPLSCILYSLER